MMKQFSKASFAFALIAMVMSFSVAQAAQELPAGARYEIGLSPNAGALDVVIKTINSAKSQILVAAYTFTSKPIAKALVDAQVRGVKVFVVADEEQNKKSYTAVTYLANEGVPVRLNGHYLDMHNKFIVTDGVNVELGSFNFSAAASSKNAENALVLTNVKPIADTYSQEWKRLWDEATPLAKKY
jgi:phosphatidylserine/phosphatidylglycerophosphate/cardiolipin synthase-like enzyme